MNYTHYQTAPDHGRMMILESIFPDPQPWSAQSNYGLMMV